MNITAYNGWIRLARSCRLLLPEIPIARIPRNGSPTPVIKNPIIAGVRFVPAYCPSSAGKIKFPAPKNNANSIVPMTKYDLNGNFVSIIPVPPKMYVAFTFRYMQYIAENNITPFSSVMQYITRFFVSNFIQKIPVPEPLRHGTSTSLYLFNKEFCVTMTFFGLFHFKNCRESSF